MTGLEKCKWLFPKNMGVFAGSLASCAARLCPGRLKSLHASLLKCGVHVFSQEA